MNQVNETGRTDEMDFESKDATDLITSVNELGVGTTTVTVDREPHEIESDIREALSNNPDVNGAAIEAKVKNGEVTLTGSVKEERERTLTEGMVKNLQGVRAVQNNIQVESRISGP